MAPTCCSITTTTTVAVSSSSARPGPRTRGPVPLLLHAICRLPLAMAIRSLTPIPVIFRASSMSLSRGLGAHEHGAHAALPDAAPLAADRPHHITLRITPGAAKAVAQAWVKLLGRGGYLPLSIRPCPGSHSYARLLPGLQLRRPAPRALVPAALGLGLHRVCVACAHAGTCVVARRMRRAAQHPARCPELLLLLLGAAARAQPQLLPALPCL